MGSVAKRHEKENECFFPIKYRSVTMNQKLFS